MVLSLSGCLLVTVAALLALPDSSHAQLMGTSRAQLMDGPRGQLLGSDSDDAVMDHPLQTKRSFLGLKCRGVFDKVTFHELNLVCQECYGLYQEPELHGLCRSECFTTEYFQGCLQALRRAHEGQKFDSAIRRLSGKK